MTFDLPIWLKAVDIIKQANLPVMQGCVNFICWSLILDQSVTSCRIQDYWKPCSWFIREVRQATTCWMENVLTRLSVLTSSLISSFIAHHETCLHWGGAQWHEDLHGDGGYCEMGAKHTDPVVAVFDTCKNLQRGCSYTVFTTSVYLQYRPETGSSCRTCLRTPVTMDGH